MANEYYAVGGIETIDFIKAKLTPEQYEGFLQGNVLKYAARANYKDCKESDYKKLAYYENLLSLLTSE